MNDDANAQYGIGIYFTNSMDMAESYGKNIHTININPKNFVDSSDDIDSVITVNKMISLFKKLFIQNEEAAYMFVTDYGFDVESHKELSPKQYKELSEMISGQEFRNFIIELSQVFGVVEFVRTWNELIPNIHGTKTIHDADNEVYIYSVMNTNYIIQGK